MAQLFNLPRLGAIIGFVLMLTGFSAASAQAKSDASHNLTVAGCTDLALEAAGQTPAEARRTQPHRLAYLIGDTMQDLVPGGSVSQMCADYVRNETAREAAELASRLAAANVAINTQAGTVTAVNTANAQLTAQLHMAQGFVAALLILDLIAISLWMTWILHIGDLQTKLVFALAAEKAARAKAAQLERELEISAEIAAKLGEALDVEASRITKHIRLSRKSFATNAAPLRLWIDFEFRLIGDDMVQARFRSGDAHGDWHAYTPDNKNWFSNLHLWDTSIWAALRDAGVSMKDDRRPDAPYFEGLPSVETLRTQMLEQQERARKQFLPITKQS